LHLVVLPIGSYTHGTLHTLSHSSDSTIFYIGQRRIHLEYKNCMYLLWQFRFVLPLETNVISSYHLVSSIPQRSSTRHQRPRFAFCIQIRHLRPYIAVLPHQLYLLQFTARTHRCWTSQNLSSQPSVTVLTPCVVLFFVWHGQRRIDTSFWSPPRGVLIHPAIQYASSFAPPYRAGSSYRYFPVTPNT
jgi:hypothetical protein